MIERAMRGSLLATYWPKQENECGPANLAIAIGQNGFVKISHIPTATRTSALPLLKHLIREQHLAPNAKVPGEAWPSHGQKWVQRWTQGYRLL